MTTYGSFNNLFADKATRGAPKPEVGMGMTELCWSDRHAYTIVEVVNEKKVYITSDTAKRVDNNGMSECQSYEFISNMDAPRILVTLRKDGKWHEGTSLKGQVYAIGYRSEYHDFSF